MKDKTASGLPASIVRATPTANGQGRWEEQGRRIWQNVNRSAWALGDWWNAGEPYGDRVEIAERIGFTHQGCRQAGWVAGKFAVSRRRDTLAWSIHQELARLPEAEQDAWLDRVEEDGMTMWEVRAALRPAFGKPPPLPTGTFDVLLADPPWRYEDVKTPNRAIETQYPTLDVEEIAALEPPAAPNAVLFCWVTSPKLTEGLRIVEAWGFNYRTCLVWVKDRIGMGYWARQRHELLLVATKGEPGVPEPADRPDSVIEAPRGRHSEKPEIVYDLIETALPDRTYLELFARSGRHGWTSWGNEV